MVKPDSESLARPGDIDISTSFLFLKGIFHPTKFPIVTGSVNKTTRKNDYLIEIVTPDDHLPLKLTCNEEQYNRSGEISVLIALKNAVKLLFEECSINGIYERRIRLLGSFLDEPEDRIFYLLTGQRIPPDSKHSHIRRISKIDL